VVEAEVQGKMQVQDSLEISEVEAFLPTALPEDQLSHDNGEHLQNYFQGLTTLA
jgi:hypothetical protein